MWRHFTLRISPPFLNRFTSCFHKNYNFEILTSTLKIGEGAPPPPWGGGLGPHLTQTRLGRGLSPYRVASWCIQPFGHNRNGPKIGEGAPPRFGQRALGLHLTQSRLGWRLRPCQVPASSIQPFGRDKHGPKVWGALRPPPLLGRGRGPHLTQSHLGHIPSDILIYAAIWPQQTTDDAIRWCFCQRTPTTVAARH